MIQQKCVYLSGYVADCLMVDEERKTIQAVALLMQKELSVSMDDFIALLGHIASQFQEMAALFELKASQ